MTKRCQDCGVILEAGICSNCHEALFIQTFQHEDVLEPMSKEFIDEARQQVEAIKKRDRNE